MKKLILRAVFALITVVAGSCKSNTPQEDGQEICDLVKAAKKALEEGNMDEYNRINRETVAFGKKMYEKYHDDMKTLNQVLKYQENCPSGADGVQP